MVHGVGTLSESSSEENGAMSMDRTTVTREGDFKSWQEALGAVLDIIEERHLKDVQRVEIDTGEQMNTMGGEKVPIGRWTISIEGYLG